MSLWIVSFYICFVVIRRILFRLTIITMFFIVLVIILFFIIFYKSIFYVPLPNLGIVFMISISFYLFGLVLIFNFHISLIIGGIIICCISISFLTIFIFWVTF